MGNTLENLSTPLYFFFLLHFFPPENNPLEAFQFLLQPELVAPKVWCTDFILASSYPIAGGISFVFHLCYILYLMDPMSSSSLVYSHVPFFFFFNLLWFVLWFSASSYSCKAWHFPSEQNTHHCFTIMVENCGAGSSALICIGYHFYWFLLFIVSKNFRSLIMCWT